MSAGSSASVVGGWAVAVSRALTAMGYDASDLLSQAGLNREQLRDPDSRPSSDNTRRLWRLAVEATGRTDVGLAVSRFVGPTTFHALGFSLWASTTLLEALQKMVRYAPLLNEGLGLELVEEGTAVQLLLEVRTDDAGQPAVAAEGIDYFLGAVVRMFRDIGDPDWAPEAVDLTRDEPSDAAPYLDLFRCPVRFSASCNALQMARNPLTRQLPTANPALARENDRIVTEYMARRVRSDVLTQVRATVLELLPLGDPTHQRVAAALRVNPRTLQYRLQRNGVNYKQLLEQIRRELGAQYLQLSQNSVTEIAYLLGYSDPSHFNRAFRRWYGCSPGEFRSRSRS